MAKNFLKMLLKPQLKSIYALLIFITKIELIKNLKCLLIKKKSIKIGKVTKMRIMIK